MQTNPEPNPESETSAGAGASPDHAPEAPPESGNAVTVLTPVPAENPIVGDGYTIHADGSVDLDENITTDQYARGLGMFKWAQTKLKISFSEYLRKGRAHKNLGVAYVDGILTQLEFDLPMVKTALDIATVPEALRLPGLEADHFAVLARAEVTPAKRKHWAQVASVQSLTANQLKASIVAGEVVSGAVARQQQSGVISVHGIRQETDIWFRRVGGLEGLLKMKDAEITEILGELQFIASIYVDLKKGFEAKTAKKAAKKPAKKK